MYWDVRFIAVSVVYALQPSTQLSIHISTTVVLLSGQVQNGHLYTRYTGSSTKTKVEKCEKLTNKNPFAILLQNLLHKFEFY